MPFVHDSDRTLRFFHIFYMALKTNPNFDIKTTVMSHLKQVWYFSKIIKFLHYLHLKKYINVETVFFFFFCCAGIKHLATSHIIIVETEAGILTYFLIMLTQSCSGGVSGRAVTT